MNIANLSWTCVDPKNILGLLRKKVMFLSCIYQATTQFLFGKKSLENGKFLRRLYKVFNIEIREIKKLKKAN